MRLLLLLVLAVGCKTEMDFPVGGGGGGGGGGKLRVDAALAGSDGGGGVITASACVLTDPRDLTTCQTSGSLGLTVGLGSASAITADDGSFTIDVPAGAQFWSITSTTGAVVQSVTPFSAQTTIPVMSSTMFSDLESINGVLPAPGNGAVMVRVARAGAPVQGEVVTVSTATDARGTFYDPANVNDAWKTDATGPFGTAYVPSATSGTTTLTLSAAGTTQGTLGGVPVTDGGVTFIFAEVL